MIRNKTTDDEEEALIREEINVYGSNHIDDNDDDYTWRSRTSSLVDASDDKRQSKRKPSSLEWATSSWTRWLYVVFFWWVNPLLKLGYNKILTDDDLDDLPHQDKSSILLEKLLIYDWSTTTTWRIVLRAFGKQTFHIGLLVFLLIAARIAQPLFLHSIVVLVVYKEKSGYLTLIGIFLSVGLYVSSMVQAFCHQHLLFRSTQIGIRIRNALTATIYRHLLSIDISSLQQTNSAQTINLVASDVAKFELLWIFGHYLWVAPLEAIITFGLLYWLIGFLPTCFAFIVLLLFIPAQIIISRYFSRFYQKTIVCSDKRIKAYSELLDGCQLIKMYNWEKLMEERVLNLRNDELSSIKLASHLRAINVALYCLAPCLMLLAAFGGLWILGYRLRSAEIFTALAFFGQIRLPVINFMSLNIERLSAVLVASKRIDTFMRLKKKQPQRRKPPATNGTTENNKSGTIIMRHASFSWGDNNPCLTSLNVDIKPGQFVGIIGSVGAGKSSLLAAILGEMNITDGNMQMSGSLSYAVQSTWIFADTIRANILIGKQFDQQRYLNVLRACCLDVDLKVFGEAGDLTMIGEKGVNLSGGQKARVSLARALYVDADIYLLDDPLAAVDSRVAKRLFDNCIGPQGLLKEKTRLLVTHQTHFLSSCDQCILLADGHIEKIGPVDQISNGHNHVNVLSADAKTDKHADDTQEITEKELDLSKSVADTKSILIDEIPITGHASWTVWRHLFTASSLGWFGLALLIILLLAGQILYDGTTFWLALWSHKSAHIQDKEHWYAYVFLGLVLGTIVVGLLRAMYCSYIMLCGSNRLHNRMLKSILNTSMRFFESNSVGRILSRASRDQQLVDELLPVIVFDAVQSILILTGSLTVIVLINPSVILVIIITLPVFWYLYHYYSRTNLQLKRLESVTRSPTYALFSSSLNGLTSIRAFKVENDFVRTFTERVDANTRAYLTVIGGIHWICLRYDLVAAIFVLMTPVLCIVWTYDTTTAFIPLALACCLNLVSRAQWIVRLFAETEYLMISAQRIDEYTKLQPEEDNGGHKGLVQIPPDWPNRGSIEFRNYTLRYRPELEPVLNNLNLRIKSNEKIGIIGRTGKLFYFYSLSDLSSL
jgi:ABC-type multidrug transport system fused ATPase/permease subunit